MGRFTEETENSVEIEVVEAFGGRYANLKATDPFIRLTVGNTVGMTDTQQKSFRHPRWYEKFVFPIQDIEVRPRAEGSACGRRRAQPFSLSFASASLRPDPLAARPHTHRRATCWKFSWKILWSFLAARWRGACA